MFLAVQEASILDRDCRTAQTIIATYRPISILNGPNILTLDGSPGAIQEIKLDPCFVWLPGLLVMTGPTPNYDVISPLRLMFTYIYICIYICIHTYIYMYVYM